MADQKILVSLDNLKQYDGLIKNYIDNADQKSIKSIVIDSTNHKVNFYKTEEPIAEGATAAYTIDLSDIYSNIGALTSLTTEAKTSLVAAINEVDAHADAAQADVDALEAIVGNASKAESSEGAGDGVAATGIIKQIEDLEAAVGEGGSVAAQITAAIEDLDAEKASSDVDDGKGIKVTVKEVDGKIESVTVAGDYSKTYDAIGAAAAVQGSTTETVASVDAKVSALGTAADANVATVAIGTENESADALPTVAQVKTYVTAEIADLEGAMHFEGVVTRADDETDAAAIARTKTSPEAGDVVVMSDNAKEYIYDGTAWREVGDEGLYVQKSTTIAGVDLQDSITKEELNTALGIVDIVKANAKDGVYTAAVEADEENGVVAKDAVTIAEAIKANADAIAALDISSDIDTKINALDAEVEQEAGTDGLALKVTEVDGKLTAVTGSIAANTYDAYGAAADVLGESTDTKDDATVYGAKAFAQSLADAMAYRVATEAEISAIFNPTTSV